MWVSALGGMSAPEGVCLGGRGCLLQGQVSAALRCLLPGVVSQHAGCLLGGGGGCIPCKQND